MAIGVRAHTESSAPGYTSTMRRSKILLILLMSLWLPLQGVAAVVMPFCKHSLAGSAGASHSEAAADDGHAAAHVGHEGSAHPQIADASGSGPALSACDDCWHCHLSCAVTLPSPALQAAELTSFAAPLFTPSLPLGTAPRPLHRPPLLALI